MRFTTAAFTLFVATQLSPVHAQSLEARKMYAAEAAKLSTALDMTNRKCGTTIKAGYDWSTFVEAEVLTKSATSWCQAALDAIEDLCGDDIGKAAIKEKVKTLTCSGAATPSADFKDGTVTFGFPMAPNQNKLMVRSMLEKKL